jgi:hypothetical protein
MVLVLLAGLNALFFWLKVLPIVKQADPHEDPPAMIKIVGMTSLLAWTGVLCLGRLIPYLGTG